MVILKRMPCRACLKIIVGSFFSPKKGNTSGSIWSLIFLWMGCKVCLVRIFIMYMFVFYLSEYYNTPVKHQIRSTSVLKNILSFYILGYAIILSFHWSTILFHEKESPIWTFLSSIDEIVNLGFELGRGSCNDVQLIYVIINYVVLL